MDSLNRKFIKYITQNVFAMIGMSCYIIADTFFISKAAGTDGITVLNLALPLYGVIFAIGAMIGVGSATRFAITRERDEKNAHGFFINAIEFDLIIGAVISVIGFFFTENIMKIMGADASIIAAGIGYNRIFLSFAPAFMLNYTVTGFVRNDGDSGLAMCATLTSCMANVILDYILMFPLKMGMEGAALATSVSPIISILINSLHFLKKKNTVKLSWRLPSFRLLMASCGLGFSSFVSEISSAVTTTVFNFILLKLSGNTAVAAYGVIANFALVATAIFNGTAQGTQPLLSREYGKGNETDVKILLKKAVVTAACFSVVIIVLVYFFTTPFVQLFNNEKSSELADLAYNGMRIYFTGFIFASFNIVAGSYFAATEKVIPAFITSVMRGMVLNILAALLLSNIFGINGVWASFAAAEALTAVIALLFMKKQEKKIERTGSTL